MDLIDICAAAAIAKNNDASGPSSNVGMQDKTSATGEIFNDYNGNTASGAYSHAEGQRTSANGECSHAGGSGTKSYGFCSIAAGSGTIAGITPTENAPNPSQPSALAIGWGTGSQYFGGVTQASGYYSVALGGNATASGYGSNAANVGTAATGEYSHAEGFCTLASGRSSHAEGGDYAEKDKRYRVQATGNYSHAEGLDTTASGGYSHAEGRYTRALGDSAHTEGSATVAQGMSGHAEGRGTSAHGDCSHAEGEDTSALSDHQHVMGKHNKEDSKGKFAFIIGNGTGAYITNRSNAFAIDWDGKIYINNSESGIDLNDLLARIEALEGKA